MDMKLNNRGYVLVEIILASVIAFGIAYYMLDLTIKLKNKNDDLIVETLVMTDKAIIQNKLVEYISIDGNDFTCDNFKINGNALSYIDLNNNEHIIDIVNKYTTIDVTSFNCSKDNNRVSLFLPLKVDQIDKTFDLQLNYLISSRQIGSAFSLGDYVVMTPTGNDFTVNSVNGNDVIDPKALNLWRVIKINADGSIELVSEYTSNKKVCFEGQDNYMDFIKLLNDYANNYINLNYTTGSRHFGYDETEASPIINSMVIPVDWGCSTGQSCSIPPREMNGGGDLGYVADFVLVGNVLGTTNAKTSNGLNASYWMASRYYNYMHTDYYSFGGRYANTNNSFSLTQLLFYDSGTIVNIKGCNYIRPIITLKPGVKYMINNDGQKVLIS